MHNLKAAIVPVLLLIAIVALAYFDVSIEQMASFEFIWDVLLGAALGASLSILPSMAGFGAKRNALASMFWFGGFLTMTLIFYQYISMLTDIRLSSLAFLTDPTSRMRIVEGAMLGYLSFTAGRA